MKELLLVLVFFISTLLGNAQGNRVFSKGEMTNFGIMDISAVNGIAWSTERLAIPGYFSVFDTANFIGCTDDANIDGYIKKYGNTPFIFPVGTGKDIRTLEISAPFVTTEAYATAWILGDPSYNLDPTSPFAGKHSVLSVSPPIAAVSKDGQWDWQVGDSSKMGSNTSGTGAGLTIIVSIPDMTAFGQTQNLRLVGWNGISWIDLSAASTASGNTENSTLRGTMVKGITAIAVGSTEPAIPLTLQLANFYATSLNCFAILNWTTFQEINTDFFSIEQSYDAVNFYFKASVKAAGSSTQNQYSISMDQPSGIMYYRLKMINTDGSFLYSPVISSLNKCKVVEYMILFPNPVATHENIYINFETAYRGRADCILFNSIGQRIMLQSIHVKEGRNQVNIKLLNFSAATYFIIVLNENGKQIGSTQKFIIQ
ncbi:MAG: T9SS type A sorting domain-containing protein [Saprospiraceae bacterium]|nr:T9SS type A sorting domain-containing protein [Candidatus Vicinibacter affinis]MBK8403356.1 T9SS type A sorting domain-containing protein [Candidatus Vicinibacter affinis]MBK8641983.1 T9SS type A sorting domain-containing protein [Candidatus Vicinibacter affinis]